MAPTAKEPETQNPATPTAPVNAAQPRVQPVALEIAVTVNGARTVEGSDKREPFSEATQTVLVFGNGAVIRLNSNVAPGQLLFLTNEKTKKEVVCQVVKSKNYRSVSGYVELEFTEPAVGFWGMRFPTDRAATTLPTSNVTPISTTPARPMPAASSNQAVAPVIAPPAKPVLPPAPVAIVPPAPVSATPTVTEKTLEPATPDKENASDELRKQTARLQEQLSSMLFSEAPKPAQNVPVVDATAITERSPKILEFAKTAPPAPVTIPVAGEAPNKPASVEFAAPARKPNPSTSFEDEEEVKIPAWLEPLARNAATTPVPASSTPPPVVISQASPSLVAFTDAPTAPAGDVDAQNAGDTHEFGGTAAFSPMAESSEPIAPRFNSDLFQSREDIGEASSGGSKKGFWIGAVAATLLLAAGGGWWYLEQSKSASANTSAGVSRTVEATKPANSEADEKFVASTTTPASTQAFSTPTPVAPSQPVTTEKEKPAVSAATNVQKIPNVRETVKNPATANSTAGKAAEPVAEPRKNSFSKLKLAAPKVTGGKGAEIPSDNEPGIALESSASSGALNSGLSSSHHAPAAPVPVGGEVKNVQLLSSVQPAYPQMARSQRISGDVKIDALIDESGRVTGMKVVSGPVLLHQAAMDALHQWKYRPATLDGKPVSMHLVVTIQFRLQ